MNYRYEIDGLRAIAVIPVILFHAGFTLFGGGFIGVDVFFVISGYLITSILLKDLERGTFTFRNFYERRARRILPALLFMLLCCLPLAWLLMFQPEMKSFSQSVLSVCLFYSNMYFAQNTGYFSEPAEFTPLLHTWSLAVEEQYYILFPLILFAVFRLGRRFAFFATLFMAVSSFIYCMIMYYLNHRSAYFFTIARAWEILAGALCAFQRINPNWKRDNFLAIAGLAFVLLPIFLYTENTPFPSHYTVIPILGASLIILFAREGTWVARVLSNRILVSIGLISYSLYIWHQPIFAFARLSYIVPKSPEAMVIMSLGALLAGYLSWRFVERPFRHGPSQSTGDRSWMAVSAFAGFSTLVVFSVSAYFSNGFPGRVSADVQAIAAEATDIGDYRNDCLNGPSIQGLDVMGACHLGVPKQKPDFILLGDSFAGAIADGVSLAAVHHNRAGLILGLHACPPIIAIGGTWERTKARCPSFQQAMLQAIDKLHVNTVILDASWDKLEDVSRMNDFNPKAKDGVEAFLNPLVATLTAMKSRGVHVYIICCSPASELSIPQALARFRQFDLALDLGPSTHEFVEFNKSALEMFSRPDVQALADIVDISGFFCDSNRCKVALDGRPLFFDTFHLSKFGSIALTPLLETIFVNQSDRASAPPHHLFKNLDSYLVGPVGLQEPSNPVHFD